jgi:hypothetical protein
VSGLVTDLSEQTITLDDLILMNLHDSHTLAAATSRKSLPSVVKQLSKYLTEVKFVAGDIMFEFGDAPEHILLVLRGSLVSVLDFLSYTECASTACMQRRRHLWPHQSPQQQRMQGAAG